MVWTVYNVCVRNSVCLSVCLSARQQRYDVVLIDTAGRMQDNEPLMRALAKVPLTHHVIAIIVMSSP